MTSNEMEHKVEDNQDKSEEKNIEETTPRFRVHISDYITGVQLAAATDQLTKFGKTDVGKMIVSFKKAVREAEKTKWQKK